MRTSTAAPWVVALALLGACSKPANQAADTTANAADATADTAATATDNAADAGGVMSAPQSPQNDAVNMDANTNEMTQTPGSNSFTESQARGQIENAGYTNVTGLTKGADGMWTGKAMKDGKTMDVSVDFKGAVAAK